MLSNVLFLTLMLFSGETLAFSGWSAFSRNKQLNGLYQFRSNFEVKQFRNGIHLNALTPPDPDEKYIKLNALRNAINSFVGFLWKGLTFPFPILRGLANESTDTGFTLVECLLAVTSYLGTGVLAYSVVFEKWSIVDALYFSVVSFTTVGYGDICPTTPASKMFSCVYGLAGVVILGAAISSIGTRLINAEVEAIQVAERASRRSLLNVFDALPRLLTNNSTQPIKFKNEPEKMEIEKQVSVPIWRQLLMKATKTVVPAFSVLFMGGLLMGRLEGWQWPDSLYYSLITAGTLGFGDFSPHTKAGRLWAVAYIPLAVQAVKVNANEERMALVQTHVAKEGALRADMDVLLSERLDLEQQLVDLRERYATDCVEWEDRFEAEQDKRVKEERALSQAMETLQRSYKDELKEIMHEKQQIISQIQRDMNNRLIEKESMLNNMAGELKVTKVELVAISEHAQQLEQERSSLRKMIKQSWKVVKSRVTNRWRNFRGDGKDIK